MRRTGWSLQARTLFRVLIVLSLFATTAATAFVSAPLLTAPRSALADDDGGGNGTGGNATGGNGTSGEEAAKKDKGKDKGEGKDKDKQKDDPADHDQGQGNDDRADPPGQGQGGPVTQLPAFRVVVECAPFGDGQSACMFVGLGDTGVKRVAVPEAAVCATVDGDSGDDGSAPEVEMLSASTGDPSYVADDASLLLLLAGTVETTASTTYWIWADDDQLYPATGPALTCDEPEANEAAAPPPPTTGAIVIRAFSCDQGVTAGADVDWYTACGQPVAGATFSVTAAVAGTAGTAQEGGTDENGRLTVADLAPGDYQVEQTDGNWCHAESDNVDDQGNVNVAAGVESTIWVFNCQNATGS